MLTKLLTQMLDYPADPGLSFELLYYYFFKAIIYVRVCGMFRTRIAF